MRTHAVAVAAVLAVTGCIEDNPNHCANAGFGCGEGMVCDACAAANNGCVAAADASESPECQVVSGGLTTGSTTIGTSSTLNPSTGPVECTENGQCSEGAPFCEMGTCVTCELLPGGCEPLDAALPVCDPDSGRCVACVDDETCGANTPVCEANACRGCLEHAECPDTACNKDSGGCLPTAQVYFVDTCGGAGTGTQGDPFCGLNQAVDTVEDPAYTLRLVDPDNAYEVASLLQVVGDEVAVVGPATIDATETIDPRAAARLYLIDVDLDLSAAQALRCDDARLEFERVVATGSNGAAAELQGCDFEAIRSVVHRLPINESGGTIRAVNSFFIAADPGAVPPPLTVDGELDLLYTTVAVEADAAAIECGSGASGIVRNSILVAEPDNSVVCSAGDLTVDFTATNDSAFAGGTNAIVTFDGQTDFRSLTGGNARLFNNNTKFRVAQWNDDDPAVDIDGEERPKGPADEDHAGADVPY